MPKAKLNVRHNHASLKGPEKSAFVSAVLKLKNNVDSVLHPGKQKRYDDFVEVHKNAMVAGPAMLMPMPHGSSLFFPWHRVMLRQFELALQAAAGNTSMSLPYWDWQRAGASDPFTDDFLGGDGDASQKAHVVTGPFAASGGKFPIRVWDKKKGDPALRREFGEDPSAWLPTHSQITTGLAKHPYYPGAGSFEGTAEDLLHNPVHRWVGGNMAEATSPNDPVFFLHHAFLDQLWEQWKTQHPGEDPYRPVSGSKHFDLNATLVFHAPNHPAPWTGSWTIKQTLNPKDLGYSYS